MALDDGGLQIPDTYAHKIETSDPDQQFNTWEVPSPLRGITEHKNYNPIYAMYVICGQRENLDDTITVNLRNFINDDLFWFQLILLFFNILIFIAFLFFFESRLQARVTRPIQELTKAIKNPKVEF